MRTNVIIMPAKYSKRKKNKKNITQNFTQSSGSTRPLLILVLDSILFLILVLALSLAMIFVSLIPITPSSHYTEYDQNEEYIETSMQMVLSSTIPKVTFNTPEGKNVEFLDLTFLDLIIIDLGIRNDGSSVFNSTSLEFGPELELKNLIKSVFGDNQDFILWAGFAGSTAGHSTDLLSNQNIIITTVMDPILHLQNSDPIFEKHLTSRINEEIGYIDTEVVIKFYLI